MIVVQAAINIIIFILWVAESRFLFRYMVRNDAFKKKTRQGLNYWSRIPVTDQIPHVYIALLAMAAACTGPIALVLIAVMWRPPMSKTEQREYVAKLEKENRQLRITQER